MTSENAGNRNRSSLCVAGLVYFEVFLPSEAADIPLGREIFVDDVGVGLGGVLNPASVAAALGLDTTLAYPRGRGPTDAAVADELQRLELGSLTWQSGDDPAISLVRSEAGDRGFASRADYKALERCPPLGHYDWVHVPGLEEAHRLKARLAEARGTETTVSVAGSWAPERLDELTDFGEPRWDVVLVNRDELERATEPVASGLRDRISQLQSAARDVVVTDGARRVHALVGDEYVDKQVPDVDAFVDATGAGDAFGAGFISARLDGASPETAIECGVDVAGTVVQMAGGVVRDPTRFRT